jgi:hypothetical protein
LATQLVLVQWIFGFNGCSNSSSKTPAVWKSQRDRPALASSRYAAGHQLTSFARPPERQKRIRVVMSQRSFAAKHLRQG